jgi:hypothetical protein
MGRVVLRTVWEENIEWNIFSVQFLIRPFLETYKWQLGLKIGVELVLFLYLPERMIIPFGYCSRAFF